MNQNDRRQAILETLCRRKHDKIGNLAYEFNVTERTVRNDIRELSKSYPVFTLKGSSYGGVYVEDTFLCGSRIVSNEQKAFLRLFMKSISGTDRKIVEPILSKYIRF